MKLSYKLIIFIVVVVVAALAGYLSFFHSRSVLQNPADSFAVTPQPDIIVPLDPATIPSGDKITLGTARGSVDVNNFYKVARGTDGDALAIRATPEYQILYNKGISAFGIYIIGGTVDAVRKVAESDLLKILGISPAQACSLTISWAVSSAVDKSLAGQSYPLSFCAPGVQ